MDRFFEARRAAGLDNAKCSQEDHLFGFWLGSAQRDDPVEPLLQYVHTGSHLRSHNFGCYMHFGGSYLGTRIRAERDEWLLHGLKHPTVMRYAYDVLSGHRPDDQCNWTWTMLSSRAQRAWVEKANTPFFINETTGRLLGDGVRALHSAPSSA